MDQVGWLSIYLESMRTDQSSGDLPTELEGDFWRWSPMPANQVQECGTLDEFHGNEELSVYLSELIDIDQVRVAKQGTQPSLVDQALSLGMVQLIGQELQGDALSKSSGSVQLCFIDTRRSS
jgi:hypothetical protein